MSATADCRGIAREIDFQGVWKTSSTTKYGMSAFISKASGSVTAIGGQFDGHGPMGYQEAAMPYGLGPRRKMSMESTLTVPSIYRKPQIIGLLARWVKPRCSPIFERMVDICQYCALDSHCPPAGYCGEGPDGEQ
jgi:hypothetical protein